MSATPQATVGDGTHSMTSAAPVPQTLPWKQRVNVRVVIFIVLVGALLGWPIYTFVHDMVTGGIHDHGDYAEVDLKAMGFFEMSPVNASIKDVPAMYRALDGRRVVLEGEIVPLNTAGNRLNEFQLVYNIQKCCFSGPPKPQERVFASVAAGKTMRYDPYASRFRVTGVLRVNVEKLEGKVDSVYKMDVEKIEGLSS